VRHSRKPGYFSGINSQERCRHPFSHYLKNFYVDTITFRPDTLRFVVELMPEGHVFMGTDYPYDMADMDPVSSVEAAVSDEALRRVSSAQT
jgi:aminocarboxymuconate-semialdehyde decarboxylase